MLGLLENHRILRLQFAVLLNGRYKDGRRGCNQYMVTCIDNYISLPLIFHAVEIEYIFVNCNAEDHVFWFVITPLLTLNKFPYVRTSTFKPFLSI